MTVQTLPRLVLQKARAYYAVYTTHGQYKNLSKRGRRDIIRGQVQNNVHDG